ncbi:MAG: tetratricopeptide repeat protein [Candidatus Obscuribacterales bacterium]|nr:tetratricopeptide repeat protein [Candidatus Obscuribacterales bacterium]
MDRPTGSDFAQYEKAGDESFSVGDFAAAELKFKAALDSIPSGSPQKTAVPGLSVKYTNALMSQGKFQEAGKELKKTLSTSKSLSGSDSVDYAEALDLQAWMYQVNGKMEDAIDSLKQSIAILEQKAPGSSDLGDAYEHMGLLQETVGLFDQSQDFYSKAYMVREKLLGANSIDAADLSEAMANVAFKRGRSGESTPLFARALRIKESRGEPWKPYAPEPTERVAVFHYSPGAPNCQQGSSDGAIIERIRANGIVVEAGISQKPSDFAKTTRALVRIKNESQYDVDVLPQPATFIQITPKVQLLKPLNAQELASRIEKKGESKAKWIKFWGAEATTPVTSYSYTQGNVPPVYGYVPGSFGWNQYAYGYGTSNYGYGRNRAWQQSTMITNVPDYQARADAYRRAAEATNKSKADAEAVRDAALGPNRLAAGAMMEGSLDFEYSKYKSCILRIPIGNAVFEFRFN